MARIDEGGAPQGVIDVTPEDFHAVALGLADGQERLHQIRLKLFTALDGNAGAAGAGDGADAFERAYQEAMHTAVAAFFRAYDVLGSVAAGIDQAGLNHWNADNASRPQPGPAPWTPLIPAKAAGSPAWPGLLGPEEWWLPHEIARYVPNADTGRLTNIQMAFEQAGDAVQALAADLKNRMFALVENNDAADVDALNDFWDRLAGGHDSAIFFVLPQFLQKLSTAFADFRVWVVDTRERIEDSVRDVVDGAGLGLAIAGIATIFTDGFFEVLAGAAELLGIDVIGLLAGPVAEISAGAVATLEGAEVIGAVAGGVTAMAMAVERTPEPNIEQADTAKLGDELGDQTARLPEPKYPEKQLQSHFKHAKDFGVDSNWSRAAANEYEQALRRFAEDPANEVNLAGTYRGDPAILIYNQFSRVCEVLRPDGTYWTGWKLNPQQLKNVVERGSL
ncbi:colicin D domain-containing protein [Amycolatopsis mongoliensis]|uniref:Colicin D domain-containing protein n=1 Tax=Amycolatopsis mongoliensis TaxID=715475 RepID=A0A9Y2JUJ1_9PSEU|nr:colicin D domain-containing protein [Amycolatopsis sp. 4-36]WIY03849.1 colicin D domain-containing protein [Amycolatopsis sp. 4-36]